MLGRNKCGHLPVFVYNQTMNPSMTPARPTLIPAISFPPLAEPFFVAVAEAPVAVPVADAPTAPRLSVWPRVGKGTLPLSAQPPAVELGHAGGEMVAEAE